jgi:hypothetical protein
MRWPTISAAFGCAALELGAQLLLQRRGAGENLVAAGEVIWRIDVAVGASAR